MFRVETVTWTMGVHAVILGVHRRTGIVKVLRYAVSHEGGREINPRSSRARSSAASPRARRRTVRGVALFATGEPLSTTFAAYHLPLTTDVPG